MIEIKDGGVIELTIEVGQGPAGPSTAVTEAAKNAALVAAQRSEDAADRSDLSAASAAGSATAAAGSASAAQGFKDASESAADRSEMAKDAAEIAKNAAEMALDEFTDVYLGRFAMDPMLDNDGMPLQIGALYYNTTTQELKIYTAIGWNTAYFSPFDVVIESELIEAFNQHRMEADPHPVYTSEMEARAQGDAAVLFHEEKTDPHPQYTTVAEAAAAAPVQFSFRNIAVMGQMDVVADAPEDVLTFVAGDNILITTDPANDSITITGVGGGNNATLAVLDEGTLLTSAATSLNFVGMGVTASNTGDAVTVSIPTYNAFAVVTGNTGTAMADGTGDTIAITGMDGISTNATDTPDGLVITNIDRGSVAVAMHEAATDPHPQYTTVAEAAAAAPVQFAFQTVSGNTGSTIADAAADTLNIVGADGLSVTATDATDTLTVQATFATANTIQPDATASAGSAPSFARSDHRHAIVTDTPVALGATAAEGTANSFARSDHVHPRPSATDIGVLSFANIAVSGQTTVVADAATDTLTLVAGTNITIETDAATDSITINSTGGGAGNSATGNIAFISLGGY